MDFSLQLSKTDSGSLTLSLKLYETDSAAQFKLISLYMSDNLIPNLLSRDTIDLELLFTIVKDIRSLKIKQVGWRSFGVHLYDWFINIVKKLILVHHEECGQVAVLGNGLWRRICPVLDPTPNRT